MKLPPTRTPHQRRSAVLVCGALVGAGLLAASAPAPVVAPAAFGLAGLPTMAYDVIGVSYPDPLNPTDVPAAAPPISTPLDQPPALGGLGAAPGAVGALGIPDVAVAAYRGAADRLAHDQPGCHIRWTLIAGIGRVESDHAHGGRVDATGRTNPLILGPVLDGSSPGDGAVPDTDHGALDGNTTWDRAVGPMQFLPATWARWGADATGDGVADPHNIFDAALGTGRYLCSGGTDLSQDTAAHDAVFRYNHSEDYVTTVLAWAHAYATGAVTIPNTPTTPATTTAPTAPPKSTPAQTPPNPSAAAAATKTAAPSAAAPTPTRPTTPASTPGTPTTAAPVPTSTTPTNAPPPPLTIP